jgi:large subunit ribosomal protein L24
MASKIRQDDEVVVLAGKEKGKRGKVKKIYSARKRAIVQGINMVKKSQKPVPSTEKPGGIFQKEASLHLSNLGLYSEETKKAERIGFRFENGRKVRFFKFNDQTVK